MKRNNESIKIGFKLCKNFIIIIIIIVLVGIIVLFNIKHIPKYVSENEPYKENTNVTENLDGCKLYCYLDISPSMLGFFYEDDSTNMYKLSNVLEKMFNENNFSESGERYICNEGIQGNISTDNFLGFMRKVNKNYDEDSETGELSEIFTNNQYKNDENDVNMIITDMNFLTDENKTEGHNKLIKDFSEQLANKLGESNICIYNIKSSFFSKLNCDKYNQEWDNITDPDKNHSFFIIIVSKDKYYNSFIDELEGNLNSENIKFSECKFELKNNMFGKHKIKFDKTILQNKNRIVNILQSINLDNLSMGKIPDNGAGFALSLAENEESSSIKELPIEKIELPGIYINDSVKSNGSQIDTYIKVYYRSNPFAYREYSGNDFITKQQAVIKPDISAKEYWLCLDLNLNKNAVFPKTWGRNIALIDIRFQMERPQYTIPQWVLSMNVNSIKNDWSKKINIKQMFEKIIDIKEKNYQENATEYQKWMGNFLIYMAY